MSFYRVLAFVLILIKKTNSWQENNASAVDKKIKSMGSCDSPQLIIAVNLTMEEHSNSNISCSDESFSGNIAWYRAICLPSHCNNTKKVSEGLYLRFFDVTSNDEGWYICRNDEVNLKTIYLTIKQAEDSSSVIMVSVLTILFTCFLIVIAAIIFIRRKKRRKATHSLVQVQILQKDDKNSTSPSTMEDNNAKIDSESEKYVFSAEPDMEIEEEYLQPQSILHDGEYYKVFRGKLKNRDVLVKKLKRNSPENMVLKFVDDIQYRKNIGCHKNIVNLIDCCTQKERLFLVTELPSFGSLKSFLRSRKSLTLTENNLLMFAFQICKGIEFLLKKNCIHKDFRAKNILVTSDYTLKISNFTETEIGPLKWQAPETILHKEFSEQSIIWTTGVVLWELFSFGDSPFPYLVPEILYQHLQTGNRLEKPEKISDGPYQLMCMCWEFDRQDRPTFECIFGVLNSLMMEVNGGYIRMDSNASEKKKSCSYIDAQSNKHHYANLNLKSDKFPNEKSHYVDMKGKLKVLKTSSMECIVTVISNKDGEEFLGD